MAEESGYESRLRLLSVAELTRRSIELARGDLSATGSERIEFSAGDRSTPEFDAVMAELARRRRAERPPGG